MSVITVQAPSTYWFRSVKKQRLWPARLCGVRGKGAEHELASMRRGMGGALRTAQQGSKSADADPLHDDLRDVMERRDHDEAGIYRLMYTTKIGRFLFVLDYFQKKGSSGGATRNEDLNRIKHRLREARKYYAAIPK